MVLEMLVHLQFNHFTQLLVQECFICLNNLLVVIPLQEIGTGQLSKEKLQQILQEKMREFILLEF